MNNKLRAQNASTLNDTADRLDPADNFNRSSHRKKWLPFKLLLMICLIAVAHSTQAALVGHFRFNGNLQDETGNHNGELRDPAQTLRFEPGKSADALRVDSPETSVECANPTTFELSQDFTIAAWVKTTEEGEVLVVYKGPKFTYAAKSRQFELYGGGGLGGNGIFMHTGDSGAYGTSFLTSHNITVNNDQWHHVAVTYSASNTPHFTLFVDGIGKVGTDPGVFFGPDFVMNLDGTDADQVLRIGGRDEAGSYTTFVGLLDEVQFYDQTLRRDQVKFLFDNPGEVIRPPTVPEIAEQPQNVTITVGPTNPAPLRSV